MLASGAIFTTSTVGQDASDRWGRCADTSENG